MLDGSGTGSRSLADELASEKEPWKELDHSTVVALTVASFMLAFIACMACFCACLLNGTRLQSKARLWAHLIFWPGAVVWHAYIGPTSHHHPQVQLVGMLGDELVAVQFFCLKIILLGPGNSKQVILGPGASASEGGPGPKLNNPIFNLFWALLQKSGLAKSHDILRIKRLFFNLFFIR